MKRTSDNARWHAVVLAGDRRPGDPVAASAAAPCKALVPVGGRSMLARVLDALGQSGCIDSITLAGPRREALGAAPEIAGAIAEGRLGWIAPAPSPSESALRGLRALAAQGPVLVTTADHPLLRGEIVDYFLREAAASGCDALAGVARLDVVKARFPRTRRTAIALRDGPYCGCNLFAFTTARGRALARYWRRVERRRKRPWRMVAGALGWGAALRYVAGRLTLEQALAALSRRLGARVGVVVLPFPEAALDVDSPPDRQLAEEVLAGR